MRQILFRGKRIDNGEWVYGSGVYLNAGAALAFIMVDGGTDEGSRKYVIPQTVGQFTGLKDKNGKEIYEGDIDEKYGSVTWNAERFRWSLVKGDNINSLNDIVVNLRHKLNIICNIHEHPELPTPSLHRP